MYYIKELLNKIFGCKYRLDIYPQFHGGDCYAARLIRLGKYTEYNDYAMKAGGTHSIDGGKTIHQGLFNDCEECRNKGFRSLNT